MTSDKADRSFDYEAEAAITFLVPNVTATGTNPKPVILHSVRVGMYLYNAGFGRDVVLGGLLHDLLEDTAVTSDDIRSVFGENVSRIVEALSLDPLIKDRVAAFQDRFERCKGIGRDALAIMAADFLDNSFHYHQGDDPELYSHLLWKARTFLDYMESCTFDARLTPILADLRRSLDRLPAR